MSVFWQILCPDRAEPLHSLETFLDAIFQSDLLTSFPSMHRQERALVPMRGFSFGEALHHNEFPLL